MPPSGSTSVVASTTGCPACVASKIDCEQPLVVGPLTRRRGLGELHVVGDHARAVAHELVDDLRVPAARERPLLADAAVLAARGTSSRRRRRRRRPSARPCEPRTEKRVSIAWCSSRSTAPAALSAERPGDRRDRRGEQQRGPPAPARRGAQARRCHASPASAAHSRGGAPLLRARRAGLVLADAAQRLAGREAQLDPHADPLLRTAAQVHAHRRRHAVAHAHALAVHADGAARRPPGRRAPAGGCRRRAGWRRGRARGSAGRPSPGRPALRPKSLTSTRPSRVRKSVPSQRSSVYQ